MADNLSAPEARFEQALQRSGTPMPGSGRTARGSRSSWRSSRPRLDAAASTPSQEHQQDQGYGVLTWPNTHARTTFIVATDRDALILEKLAGIEEAIQGLVPLLEKIITQLETPDAAAHGPHGDLRGPVRRARGWSARGRAGRQRRAGAERTACGLVETALDDEERAMNVVELILDLGRWGQAHHDGSARRGCWLRRSSSGGPVSSSGARQAADHHARLGPVGDPPGSATGGALWAAGRGPGAPRRAAAL